MIQATQIRLPYLEMEDPEFGADPAVHFARAREQHPNTPPLKAPPTVPGSINPQYLLQGPHPGAV